MRNVIVALSLCAFSLASAPVAAQPDSSSGQGSSSAQAKGETPRPSALRTRANVKVELTISDQTGNGPVEKKVVSLIAAEESWGKIRTQAAAKPSDVTAGPVVPVGLNVDARPWLTSTGQIQLELTIGYNPLDAGGREGKQLRPTELNQSMTVVLQSGKPLVISQAADPIADRKMIVEVVATVLK